MFAGVPVGGSGLVSQLPFLFVWKVCVVSFPPWQQSSEYCGHVRISPLSSVATHVLYVSCGIPSKGALYSSSAAALYLPP